MATYNAISLAGYQVDYFKLALEFEYNATLYVPVIGGFCLSGTFGSDPNEIRHCLDSYNIPYTTYETKKYDGCTTASTSFDSALPIGKSGIVSYKFGFLHLLIHTFAVKHDLSTLAKPAYTVNRFSDQTTPWHYQSITSTLEERNNNFTIGYILY